MGKGHIKPKTKPIYTKDFCVYIKAFGGNKLNKLQVKWWEGHYGENQNICSVYFLKDLNKIK